MPVENLEHRAFQWAYYLGFLIRFARFLVVALSAPALAVAISA